MQFVNRRITLQTADERYFDKNLLIFNKNILQVMIEQGRIIHMTTALPSSRREKVRRMSQGFRTLCRIFLGLGLLVIVGLIVPYVAARSGRGPDLYSAGATTIGIAGLCYWVAGAWVLERLFSNFVAGRYLEASSGLWLKRFGFWMATCCAFPVGARWLWDVALYGGPGAIRDTPLPPIIGSILVGMFLIMLGWVLEEAAEVQAEQELTI
jgi:hypothetical protein